jgi:23S rRNA (cytosine1962-C5)-methyltransferase
MSKKYELLDCGDQKKIENFGDYKVIRPCPQAMWSITKPELWEYADSEFKRKDGDKGTWQKIRKDLPKSWIIESQDNILWKIEPNDYGNMGVFTEHWLYAFDLAKIFNREGKVLNLFSYTGSNSIPLVSKGFSVTVVDSSKNAMNDYTKNLELNELPREGQRLILEDVHKFVAREIRRKVKYSAIVIDAPSFGRGTKGEVFNIENDLVKLLKDCKNLLSKDGQLVMTLHSPRFTLGILNNLIKSIFDNKKIKAEEILNPCKSGMTLPSGFLVKVL